MGEKMVCFVNMTEVWIPIVCVKDSERRCIAKTWVVRYRENFNGCLLWEPLKDEHQAGGHSHILTLAAMLLIDRQTTAWSAEISKNMPVQIWGIYTAEHDHSLMFCLPSSGTPFITLVWLKISAKCLKFLTPNFPHDDRSLKACVLSF